MRVDGQAEAMLNDQWLITDVQHSGKQLAPLQHCPTGNVIQILHAVAAEASCAPISAARMRETALEQPALARYFNAFQVIPWAMPFRPSLEHDKPCLIGAHAATQTMDGADRMGRVKVRYDWQPADVKQGGEDSWARITHDLGLRTAGTRLNIMFFEGDPDQPVVCSTLVAAPLGKQLTRTLLLDGNGCDRPDPVVQLRANQLLRVHSQTSLILRSSHATLTLSEAGIHLAPVAATDVSLPSKSEEQIEVTQDLRLVEPADPMRPLPHCQWYIVRMPTPDLALLARIAPEDILFEGTTDLNGWLGLSPVEFSRLLSLDCQASTPLCLVHPGHCRTLRSCFHLTSTAPPSGAAQGCS
jgi:type VI secretion system secreted protein VgrG